MNMYENPVTIKEDPNPQTPSISDIPRPTDLTPAPIPDKIAGNKKRKILGLVLVLSVVAALTISYALMSNKHSEAITTKSDKPQVTKGESFETVTFKDADEYIKYLEESSNLSSMPSGMGVVSQDEFRDLSPNSSSVGALGGVEQNINRVSETNVQIPGIDEPDIVKTDGRNIYYSTIQTYWDQMPVPMILEDSSPSYKQSVSQTKIITAFPPNNMSEIANVPENGDLLLSGNNLIVFADDRIIAYDVAHPSAPKEKWKKQLKENSKVVTSRLLGNDLYIVTNTVTHRSRPCPMPLLDGNTNINIACSDIYRPRVPASADTIFTIIQIDPEDGSVSNRKSFIGGDNSTVVYMSESSVYVTFRLPVNDLDIVIDFFLIDAADILPKELIDQLKQINEYNISSQAKMVEFERLFELYEEQIRDEEFDKILEEKFESFYKRKVREFTKTGIVRVGINNFDIEASSAIPGSLLNQFSIDEFGGNLRVATTIGESSWGNTELNENDLYVLDNNLDIVGSTLGMGKSERIYSVRFVGNKAYVVTFRQTDPFYVLDLSDPSNPQIKGELKIPGFSSYLHPITDNRILGVGEEGGLVKVSLFNVDNPENPIEASKYQLNDFWSEVSNNHHAFLLDPQNQVFFLPGMNNGYVFSYSQDVLSMVKELTDIQAKRAVYINDYLYIVGSEKIVVFDESSWTQIKEMQL